MKWNSIHEEFDVEKEKYIRGNSIQAGLQDMIVALVAIVWDLCSLVALGPFPCVTAAVVVSWGSGG